MSVRYRLDFEQPVVECCGLQYDLTDKYKECQVCGEAFDWNDILEAWNVVDWSYLLESTEFKALGIDLAFHGVGDLDDGDAYGEDNEDGLGDGYIPPWAFHDQQDLFKDRHSLDLTENYEDLFESNWRGNPTALPPTAPLRSHHDLRERRQDPFFDVAIPDEVL